MRLHPIPSKHIFKKYKCQNGAPSTFFSAIFRCVGPGNLLHSPSLPSKRGSSRGTASSSHQRCGRFTQLFVPAPLSGRSFVFMIARDRGRSLSSSAGVEKSPTGINGVDSVLAGGLPKGRPTLICGGAGCGKTLFSMEFL